VTGGDTGRIVEINEKRNTREFLGLFRNGNFSLLWASTLASQLGDHLNLMALTALIFAMSQGATKGLEFSKILLLASAPVLIFGPISGVYADRLSRKKLMIASDLLRAGLVAAIPLFAGSMAPVYVVVFLVFTINRFYLSAKSAAIPQLVDGSRLLAANSLLNVAAMATIMLGPWGGGLLVDRFGYTVGFLADSGTYVISAVLAAFITLRSISEIEEARREELARRRRALGESARHTFAPHTPAELAEGAAKLGREIAAPIEEEVEVIGSAYSRLVSDLRSGVRAMKGNRIVLYSTISLSAIMFIAGFVLIACPVMVRNEFGVGTADVGMLFSVGGIGMLIGSIAVGRFLHDTPRRAIITVSFVLSGVVIGALSLAGTVPVLGFWIFMLGLLVAPIMVTSDTILQESMSGETVGKAFGFRDMVSRAAFGVAGIVSGIVVDIIGPRPLLILVAFACVGYSIVSLFLLADTTKLNLLNAYPLLRAGSALAAGLPRRVSYWIASVLSAVAFIVLPDKRRGARENGARVIRKPVGSREVDALARGMFRSYALYWADFFGLNGRGASRVRDIVRLEGLQHLKNALERGKGAILVTAHLGSWDMGGAALAATGELPDLSAIVEPVSKGSSDVRVTTMRESRGIKVIPLGRPLGIGRALRRNEIVFLVGERLVNGDGVEVEFFGEKTLFPRGAAYWSVKCGAPVVPGFCIRQPDGTYVGHIEEPIEPESGASDEEEILTHTQRIARVIERYISRYPDQWCMLQPIWRGRGSAR
jgi:KDO2-lipid IV(A) lauroyltransferase